MSELDALRDQIAELNQNMMAVKGLLGEVLSKAHAPGDCKLNERVAIIEKQQNRWAGGIVALLSLASLLSAGIALVVNKLWR